ncbi:uncharacterized protein M421DRAFT_393125 [Didymella exigua CBS 183.55]|uniref:Uncharacterized protein n=1 Tax=Didymella exigua CBS 183.55 TaxID=1150837 RepID=A0A6A5RIZ2_9PLEO|nr:uncharacterized protein M421DRAFT_393125 [Didymella exigua CBS 183.55]KAF1927589.1 hypothetical protein M421DRAFT_393125 [Didymella exigua CBS 183.55]
MGWKQTSVAPWSGIATCRQSTPDSHQSGEPAKRIDSCIPIPSVLIARARRTTLRFSIAVKSLQRKCVRRSAALSTSAARRRPESRRASLELRDRRRWTLQSAPAPLPEAAGCSTTDAVFVGSWVGEVGQQHLCHGESLLLYFRLVEFRCNVTLQSRCTAPRFLRNSPVDCGGSPSLDLTHQVLTASRTQG